MRRDSIPSPIPPRVTAVVLILSGGMLRKQTRTKVSQANIALGDYNAGREKGFWPPTTEQGCSARSGHRSRCQSRTYRRREFTGPITSRNRAASGWCRRSRADHLLKGDHVVANSLDSRFGVPAQGERAAGRIGRDRVSECPGRNPVLAREGISFGLCRLRGGHVPGYGRAQRRWRSLRYAGRTSRFSRACKPGTASKAVIVPGGETRRTWERSDPGGGSATANRRWMCRERRLGSTVLGKARASGRRTPIAMLVTALRSGFWHERQRHQATLELRHLDDRALRDIGISRGEIDHLAGLRDPRE
jgi:uncharacterized protein YjiS (DUF1127 family)